MSAVISGVLSLFGFIDRNTHLIPREGGSYREAAIGQPRYLNPILAGSNDVDMDITRLVYSSLFRLDENLVLQNDLAERYELSSDQKQYTIYLRKDVRWHDGQPFTADDVVFTIRSIQTSDYGSPLASSFQGVDIEKVDEATVKFTLKQVYAPFLNILTVGIAPHHVWETIAPKNAALAEQILKPIGTGPFQFAEMAQKRKTGEITTFRLVRNEHYYGQRPYLDDMSFVFFPTHEEAMAALTAGRVDGMGFLPLQLLEMVSERSSLSLHHLILPQYFGLFFNQTKNPILADIGVRNALALAINRPELVEKALFGQGEPLHLPIPPGGPAYNDQLAPPEPNAEVARQNLEDAGWKDTNGDGIREKKNQELRLKITTTDWPEYVRTADLIRQQWQAIGVKVDIDHVGAGTIQQTIVRPRDYEVLLFGEILSAEPDPYPFWHSSQIKSPGLNFALFKDKDVDRILEQARQTTDAEKRRQQYGEFQAKILDLKPAIILYRPYYLYSAGTKVRGIATRQAGLPSDRFNGVSSWHVKTKRVWND